MYLRHFITNISYAALSFKSVFYFTINAVFPWVFIYDGPDIIFLLYNDISENLYNSPNK